MAIQLQSYSAYLKSISALVGIPYDRITTEIAEVFRIGFNTAMEIAWDSYNWLSLCPNGEARFVGNKLTYPNNLTANVWSFTAAGATANSIANPMDGRITASKFSETAILSTHEVFHSVVAQVTNTTYIYSAYVRPNGRSWVYLNLDDGDLAHTCFFNVQTGVLGTATNCTGNIQNVGNGFYLCSIQYTTSLTVPATVTTIGIQTSTDGSTLSFLGDTTKGLYIWGVLLQQTTNTSINDSLVAYDQLGERVMDTVFQVWQDSPYNTTFPRAIGYSLTPDGIQIIGTNTISYATVNSAGVTITTPQSNPVFVFYRKRIPDYYGDDYDSSATYEVLDQIYFTNAKGVSNYYKCIVDTTVGQSPETTPASWELLEIPDSVFWAVVWYSYADWLTQDGQPDKAAGAMAAAENKLNAQIDKESRQMARDFPLRVATHVTSQPRSASY